MNSSQIAEVGNRTEKVESIQWIETEVVDNYMCLVVDHTMHFESGSPCLKVVQNRMEGLVPAVVHN